MPLMRWKTWQKGSWWIHDLEFNPWMAPNSVTSHIERLATAMTNAMRSAHSRNILQGQARMGLACFPVHAALVQLDLPCLDEDENVTRWSYRYMEDIGNANIAPQPPTRGAKRDATSNDRSQPWYQKSSRQIASRTRLENLGNVFCFA